MRAVYEEILYAASVVGAKVAGWLVFPSLVNPLDYQFRKVKINTPQRPWFSFRVMNTKIWANLHDRFNNHRRAFFHKIRA